MDLRRLAQFVAVAETLHFGRAAERLSMAQPPLSRAIRNLEEELGVALFECNKKRVLMSDAGRALLPEAKALLAGAALMSLKRPGVVYRKLRGKPTIALELGLAWRRDNPSAALKRFVGLAIE